MFDVNNISCLTSEIYQQSRTTTGQLNRELVGDETLITLSFNRTHLMLVIAIIRTWDSNKMAISIGVTEQSIYVRKRLEIHHPQLLGNCLVLYGPRKKKSLTMLDRREMKYLDLVLYTLYSNSVADKIKNRFGLTHYV